MDICRAFDIFELIMGIILVIMLLFAIWLLIVSIRSRIKEVGKHRARKESALYFIGGLIGLPIGYAIAQIYIYIKSMFC